MWVAPRGLGQGFSTLFHGGPKEVQIYTQGPNEHPFLSFSYIFFYVFQRWSKGQATLVGGRILPTGCLLRTLGLGFKGLSYRSLENFTILSIMAVLYPFLNCQEFSYIKKLHKNLLIHVIKVLIQVIKVALAEQQLHISWKINKNKLRQTKSLLCSLLRFCRGRCVSCTDGTDVLKSLFRVTKFRN